MNNQYDFCIVGGGMVGLSIANQLIERKISSKILIVDKEKELGLHSSGLNSGVLHAGLYYEPNTLKAKVCVEGARKLKRWIKERHLPINDCGKVIVPQEPFLDKQLDLLYQRGIDNGAKVELWDEKELKQKFPIVRTSSGRALWSPNTSVVKSKLVLKRLEKELREQKVIFRFNEKLWRVDPSKKELIFTNGDKVNYSHFINCAGLRSDEVAQKFGLAKNYTLIPFKGIYWEIINKFKFDLNTNIYPVPDLNIPFLGVHFTPTADKTPTINVGPTATFALGRENYSSLENIELFNSSINLFLLAKQYIFDIEGFRKYVHEQSMLFIKPLMINSAKKLIPSIDSRDLKISTKVGIRPQLFNKNTQKLENDFLTVRGQNSTHVLNAISPAFTASFALADLIIDQNKDYF